MKGCFVHALLFLFSATAFADSWRVSQDGSGDFRGSNDECLRAAIERAKESGGGEIVVETGLYRIERNISLHDAKHLIIRGQGDVTLQLAPALVSELDAPAAIGAETLTLRSPVGLQPGLRLRIMAPGEIVALTGQPKSSFEADILEVSGSTVRLKEPLLYAAPSGARVLNDRDLNLFAIGGDSEDVTIENLTLDGALEPDGLRQATHHTRCGVWLQGSYDYETGPKGPKPRRITIRNCRLRNFHGRGIAIYSADDCVVENCVIENVLDEGINLDHFAVRCRVVGNLVHGAKVGIELNDVNDSVVERNFIENCHLGIRVWRYCKLAELNMRNQILANRLSDISGLALEFREGTCANIARRNVLVVAENSGATMETQFLDSGSENLLELNRLENGDSSGAAVLP